MDTIEALNAKFGIENRLRFLNGNGGLAMARVDTPACRAELYLHGGHLTSWRPAGQGEVLWLSPDSRYEPSRAIRGGIPLCWPWFGAHPTGG